MRSGTELAAWRVAEHLKLAALLLPYEPRRTTSSGYATNNLAVWADDLVRTISGFESRQSDAELKPPLSYPAFCYRCKRIAAAFCPVCEHCQHSAPITTQYLYDASWAQILFFRIWTPLHHSRQRDLERAVLAAHSRNSRWAAKPASSASENWQQRLQTKAIAPLLKTSTPPATQSSNDSLLALARSRLISLRQQAK